MDSPGATQMANIVALFSPRRWYDLVPDQNHTLVTSGYGSFGQDDYVTAASTPDGKLAIAYLPSGGTVTVDLGTFSGPVDRPLVRPDGRDVHDDRRRPAREHRQRDLATPRDERRRRRRLGARTLEVT